MWKSKCFWIALGTYSVTVRCCAIAPPCFLEAARLPTESPLLELPQNSELQAKTQSAEPLGTPPSQSTPSPVRLGSNDKQPAHGRRNTQSTTPGSSASWGAFGVSWEKKKSAPGTAARARLSASLASKPSGPAKRNTRPLSLCAALSSVRWPMDNHEASKPKGRFDVTLLEEAAPSLCADLVRVHLSWAWQWQRASKLLLLRK